MTETATWLERNLCFEFRIMWLDWGDVLTHHQVFAHVDFASASLDTILTTPANIVKLLVGVLVVFLWAFSSLGSGHWVKSVTVLFSSWLHWQVPLPEMAPNLSMCSTASRCVDSLLALFKHVSLLTSHFNNEAISRIFGLTVTAALLPCAWCLERHWGMRSGSGAIYRGYQLEPWWGQQAHHGVCGWRAPLDTWSHKWVVNIQDCSFWIGSNCGEKRTILDLLETVALTHSSKDWCGPDHCMEPRLRGSSLEGFAEWNCRQVDCHLATTAVTWLHSLQEDAGQLLPLPWY